MEEDFKKRKEDDGGEDEIAKDGEIQGMVGVGGDLDVLLDVGVGVLEAVSAEDVVLEEVCEDVLMDGLPSWGTVRGENEERLKAKLGVDCLEEAASAKEGILDCGGLPVGVKEGVLGENGGVGKEAAVLNWKKAVMGGGVNVEEGCRTSDCGRKGGEAAGVGRNVGQVKGGVDGGGSVQWKDIRGRPVKVCREIQFDEGKGGFLDADGETMHMDRSEILECEKSLERALVGRILGRQVPFGFLHRELRKKWGKFGRAHLSLVGNNSFVCFFLI